MHWIKLTIRNGSPIYINMTLASDISQHADGSTIICFPAGVPAFNEEVYNIVVKESIEYVMSQL